VRSICIISNRIKGVRIVIANNMWWCRDSDAVELFRRTDSDIWEETYHSPMSLQGCLIGIYRGFM
jgi:hypothetical protein